MYSVWHATYTGFLGTELNPIVRKHGFQIFHHSIVIGCIVAANGHDLYAQLDPEALVNMQRTYTTLQPELRQCFVHGMSKIGTRMVPNEFTKIDK